MFGFRPKQDAIRHAVLSIFQEEIAVLPVGVVLIYSPGAFLSLSGAGARGKRRMSGRGIPVQKNITERAAACTVNGHLTASYTWRDVRTQQLGTVG